jgi:hypothetical protein
MPGKRGLGGGGIRLAEFWEELSDVAEDGPVEDALEEDGKPLS